MTADIAYLQNPQLPFHAWLRQLACDRLADMYRRQLADKRSLACEQSAAPEQCSEFQPANQLADTQLTPAAMLLRKEFSERFQYAVEQLADVDRELILMRHTEQLTNSQAAEVLGVSEAAAGMRYLRALRQLKSFLGESPSLGLE